MASLRHVHLVRRHGLGVAVRPQFGPDRQDDAYPLTEAAEVAASRRILARRLIHEAIRRQVLSAEAPPVVLLGATAREIEAYGSAEQLGAARDLELWGEDPFGEGE